MRTTVAISMLDDKGTMMVREWKVADPELLASIREQLGDPVLEVLLDRAMVTAAVAALDTSGAIVL